MNYADRVQKTVRPVGKFLVLYGPHGIGKTTFAAQADESVFVQARDRSLDVLASSGLIDKRPTIDVTDWNDALNALDWLATPKAHDYRVVVIDGISGLEEMCDEYTLSTDYKGNRERYLAYGAGHRFSADHWGDLLNSIEKIKDQGITAILLGHRGLSDVKNAEGANYSKFMPGMHQLKFTPTAQYSDAVLRMDYVIEVRDINDQTKKGKASGTSKRYLFCDGEVSFEAKNRLGLPPLIDLGNKGHKEAWSRFVEALSAVKESK